MFSHQLVFVIISCLFVFTSWAQPRPVETVDFQVTASGESAIYIYNDAETEIVYDSERYFWKVRTKYLTRLKLLNKDGLDLANVKIPLYVEGKGAGKRERLTSIEAATFNLDEASGSISKIELSENDIIRNKVNENREEVIFVMPGARESSVLELIYVIESPFWQRLDDWYFQKDHPVISSRYYISVPEMIEYVYLLSGSKQPEATDVISVSGNSYDFNEAYWLMEDLPGFRMEDLMTNRDDHISKLTFQLQSVINGDKKTSFLKSWENVMNDLQGNKRFNQFYAGKKDFDLMKWESASNPLLTAQLMYAAFKSRFSWDGKYAVYPNVSFSELMSARNGNASSLGLALFQVLKQSGFQVKPVLLSPRFNEKINPKYPFEDRFIATVVRLTIENQVYLLDPINPVPFGYLAPNLLRGEGLVLGDSVAWQDLTRNAIEYKASTVRLNVTEDEIDGNIEFNMRDYGTISKEENLETLFNTDWEVSNVTYQENTLTRQKVGANIKSSIDDDLILIPLTFDQLIFNDSPFESEERQYPIDFYFKKQYSYMSSIELSEAFEFESLPESQLIRTNDNQMNAALNVSQLGNTVTLTFLFWTRKQSFDAKHYPSIKRAYDLMAELSNGAIIVKRKE